MNIEEILKFLSENPQEMGKIFTSEQLDNYISTEEGKKYLQPKLDRHATQSINTWKQNNLDKAINEEIAKRFPNETPEQKRIRELEKLVEQQTAETKKKELTIRAAELAREYGLDPTMASFFVGGSEEETRGNVYNAATAWKNSIAAAVTEKQKGTAPGATAGAGQAINKETFVKMGLADRQKLLNENPQLYKELSGK